MTLHGTDCTAEVLAGPFIGISVLNWITRHADPSETRSAVVLANIVGFGAVAANDVWGVFGGEARELGKLFRSSMCCSRRWRRREDQYAERKTVSRLSSPRHPIHGCARHSANDQMVAFLDTEVPNRESR
jgi:hypothetical protein